MPGASTALPLSRPMPQGPPWLDLQASRRAPGPRSGRRIERRIPGEATRIPPPSDRTAHRDGNGASGGSDRRRPSGRPPTFSPPDGTLVAECVPPRGIEPAGVRDAVPPPHDVPFAHGAAAPPWTAGRDARPRPRFAPGIRRPPEPRRRRPVWSVQLHTRASNCTLLSSGQEPRCTRPSARIPRVPRHTVGHIFPQQADDLTRRREQTCHGGVRSGGVRRPWRP